MFKVSNNAVYLNYVWAVLPLKNNKYAKICQNGIVVD